MYPVSIDLLDTKVHRGWGVPRLVPLLTSPLHQYRRRAALSLLRNAASCHSSWGCRCVTARSIILCLDLRSRPWLLCPRPPAPPLSLPRSRLPCDCPPLCPMLVPSSMGCDIGTLSQTSAGQAGASGLAELTSRVLAFQYGPAFTAGVDGRTSRLFWCRGVSHRRCPFLLQLFFTLDLDQSASCSNLVISVFDSLYC